VKFLLDSAPLWFFLFPSVLVIEQPRASFWFSSSLIFLIPWNTHVSPRFHQKLQENKFFHRCPCSSFHHTRRRRTNSSIFLLPPVLVSCPSRPIITPSGGLLSRTPRMKSSSLPQFDRIFPRWYGPIAPPLTSDFFPPRNLLTTPLVALIYHEFPPRHPPALIRNCSNSHPSHRDCPRRLGYLIRIRLDTHPPYHAHFWCTTLRLFWKHLLLVHPFFKLSFSRGRFGAPTKTLPVPQPRIDFSFSTVVSPKSLLPFDEPLRFGWNLGFFFFFSAFFVLPGCSEKIRSFHGSV